MVTSKRDFLKNVGSAVVGDIPLLREQIEARMREIELTGAKSFTVDRPKGIGEDAVKAVIAEYTQAGWSVSTGGKLGEDFLRFS